MSCLLEVGTPVARAIYQLWSGQPTPALDPELGCDRGTQLAMMLEWLRTHPPVENPCFVMPALDEVESKHLQERLAAACDLVGIDWEAFDIPPGSKVRASPWLRLGPAGPAFTHPTGQFLTVVFAYHDVLGNGTHSPVIVESDDPAIRERLGIVQPHDQVLLVGGGRPDVTGSAPCSSEWGQVPTEVILAGAPT